MRMPQPRTPERHEIITLAVEMPKEPPPPPKGWRGKVLLLDDRDDFRNIIHEYLVSAGYDVVSVESGVEGVQEIMKGRFDLIICDMMMPRMGGEMFYWAVTRVRPGTAKRFIFFTGHRNNPPIEHFFERVNATVLLKPFGLKALETAIQNVLRKAA